MSGLTKTTSSHSARQLFNLRKVLGLVIIIINSGGQLLNPKMIFNEVAFVIYYIHFPLITQQSLLHNYKHLTHQCVIAGEAKRLSTGTEKNP